MRDARAKGRRGEDYRRGGGQAERLKPTNSLVFGVEPIRELIAAAADAVRTLRIRKGDDERFRHEIQLVRQAGGNVLSISETELEGLAGRGSRHQGIIAEVREYQYADLDDLVKHAPDPLILVDGVTDPRNLGALLRSAEGAGVKAVILARDRTTGVIPAAIKSSAGAWIHLKIARCGNVARTLEMLKDEGYWIAALAPSGNVSIYELDTTRKLAIVVGSEGEGVRPIVRKAADYLVSIPMRGQVDSLNVSVAAAVALFEITRRRGSSPLC